MSLETDSFKLQKSLKRFDGQIRLNANLRKKIKELTEEREKWRGSAEAHEDTSKMLEAEKQGICSVSNKRYELWQGAERNIVALDRQVKALKAEIKNIKTAPDMESSEDLMQISSDLHKQIADGDKRLSAINTECMGLRTDRDQYLANWENAEKRILALLITIEGNEATIKDLMDCVIPDVGVDTAEHRITKVEKINSELHEKIADGHKRIKALGCRLKEKERTIGQKSVDISFLQNQDRDLQKRLNAEVLRADTEAKAKKHALDNWESSILGATEIQERLNAAVLRADAEEESKEKLTENLNAERHLSFDLNKKRHEFKQEAMNLRSGNQRQSDRILELEAEAAAAPEIKGEVMAVVAPGQTIAAGTMLYAGGTKMEDSAIATLRRHLTGLEQLSLSQKATIAGLEIALREKDALISEMSRFIGDAVIDCDKINELESKIERLDNQLSERAGTINQAVEKSRNDREKIRALEAGIAVIKATNDHIDTGASDKIQSLERQISILKGVVQAVIDAALE